MQNSIWEEEKLPCYTQLDQDIETEVLVIGGGICGILCGYFLSKKHKVILVEGKTIASSRTKNTTAVITALQDIYYKDLIKRMGRPYAKMYLEANLNAIEEYDKLSTQYNFDFMRVPSYKYFKNQHQRMIEELAAIQSIGFQPQVEDGYAICFPDQGQMNPLKLLKALLSSMKIYENTRIEKIKDQVAYTKKFKIKAKYIVVATGYPFLRFKGGYPLKLTQKKSYVAVVKNIQKKNDFNAIGCDAEDLYFRTYQNHLIIGGNEQKTGKMLGGMLPILQYIEKNYPNHEISYQWVNQDCVSADGLPYIGKYFKKEAVFVATGFNLWGMTGSMIAAQLICDLVEGNKNPLINLFYPYRKTPFLPLLKNGVTAVTNLLLPKKRCTHLGCALCYNKEEETYECPCHGTKYDNKGNILYNPANHDKKL